MGQSIYVFGGRCGLDIGEEALHDLHSFDAAAATWRAVEPATDVRPPRRSYAAAAAAGGKFYVFGGCGEGSTGRLNDLWEFCTEKREWRQLPSSDAIKVGDGGQTALAPELLPRNSAAMPKLLNPKSLQEFVRCSTAAGAAQRPNACLAAPEASPPAPACRAAAAPGLWPPPGRCTSWQASPARRATMCTGRWRRGSQ